ncbi:helix-turn-helix transcriptional regulator [Paraburkholderia panacisoli]|jgi:DNA-binding CsgD family transcriptional regulator|uniref:Helix-turn-helix transcriptional regulator n=1 Tax=Paraburkholderia panacisoli TaxID=2603818 RepID=A0A5B0G6Z2_9BURK|nr:helix-turn-helix transcriptional regulator [Paraburkholderia panacisoli]KAA0998455.1 helix-turn-helix transcriptional regulator [Paraburkholderia panacisoli]
MDSSLTPREKEVLDLLRLGLSNRAIASRLEIGLDTARRYTSRVKQKTGVPSTFALPCFDLPDESDWPGELDLGGVRISETEMRVLRLLCRGHSSKHIGRVLQVSPRTVDKHRERLLRKFGLQSTRQLTAWIASRYAKCGIGKRSDES